MWTKSQKISATVLGLAVTAFGADRWVLNEPKDADADSASVVVEQPLTPAKKAASPSVAAKPATPAPTLASRLAAMADTRRLAYETAVDAFIPAEAWLETLRPMPLDTSTPDAAGGPAGHASAGAPAPKIDHAAEFLRTHTLAAVMSNDNHGMAIVNGKTYTPGQVVDGFKLVRLGLTDVTFSGKGTTVVLRMPGQSVAEAR